MQNRTTPPASKPRLLTDLLDNAVARFPDRAAMDFLGRRWRYRELGRLVNRATRGLQDLGVGPGTAVGLCLPNTPYYIICYYAVLRAGGIVVNFNPLYVERELLHQIRDSGATIMVTLDLEAVYRRVANVAEEGGLQHLVVCPMAGVLPAPKAALFTLLKRRERAAVPRDGRHVRFAELVRNQAAPDPVAADPASPAVLQYTGGTTGLPKGAILTHANLIANLEQSLALWSDAEPGQERLLAVLPFFHVFAMTTVLNYGIALASEIIMLPRFAVKPALDTIKRRRATLLNAVPTIYTAINSYAAANKTDLSSIKFSTSGGAPLPPEVRSRFIALTGCKLVEGYGLTEASPVVSSNPTSTGGKPGSAGLPVADTVIEIRDPAAPERILAANERGEVCVRGPQVMAGYWKRPAESAATFVDGALRTGDIGYLDEDGYLFLVDRIKDVILCSGFNVYPRVLEDALYEHPAVLEATVIGVADPYRGQAPKAFVVLRPAAAATPEQLLRHLARYVSKIELPREIELRESLPKTPVGKLSKKELVAEEQAKAQPSQTAPASSRA